LNAFGVYVHVPFCRERCDYCAFATYTDRDHLMERYADACVLELQRAIGAGDLASATSVFFGGGTPSRLRPETLCRVLDAIPRAAGAEVTVECNPEDADAAHNTLTALHGIGPWTADVYLLFCLRHGDAWPAGDLAVQEAVKIGLGLKTRPTAKEMAPLAEPWRPMRGAAAHLWWAYYRAIRKREGVIADKEKTNAVSNTARAVSNNVPVAKGSSAEAKITTGQLPRSKK